MDRQTYKTHNAAHENSHIKTKKTFIIAKLTVRRLDHLSYEMSTLVSELFFWFFIAWSIRPSTYPTNPYTAKAVKWNEMPISRDTDTILDAPQEAEISGLKPHSQVKILKKLTPIGKCTEKLAPMLF